MRQLSIRGTRTGFTRQIVQTLGRHSFPVEVLTKSDLVLRDLDLYLEIGERSWPCVLFTITAFDEGIAARFEPGAPTPERRLEALSKVAEAGLTTGVAMMPLLPGITDGDRNIREVVGRVRDAGGQFVIGGGLTLKEGAQRDRYGSFLELHYPQVLPLYGQLCGGGLEAGAGYGPHLLRRVREARRESGVADHMRRPVLAGDPLAGNRRVAEKLFLRSYDLLLEEAARYRQWAYRLAAWAIDELDTDLSSVYEQQGRRGLESIKGVGKKLAGEIAGWLQSPGGLFPAGIKE